jgi:hypothetical protein
MSIKKMLSRIVAVGVFASVIAFTGVGCGGGGGGKPSGTYTGSYGSYVFSGNNLTMDIPAAGMKLEGTYTVEKVGKGDNAMNMVTFKFKDQDGNEQKQEFSYVFEGKDLKISGGLYKKQ